MLLYILLRLNAIGKSYQMHIFIPSICAGALAFSFFQLRRSNQLDPAQSSIQLLFEFNITINWSWILIISKSPWLISFCNNGRTLMHTRILDYSEFSGFSCFSKG